MLCGELVVSITLLRSQSDFGIHSGLAQNVQLLAQDSACVLCSVLQEERTDKR